MGHCTLPENNIGTYSFKEKNITESIDYDSVDALSKKIYNNLFKSKIFTNFDVNGIILSYLMPFKKKRIPQCLKRVIL